MVWVVGWVGVSVRVGGSSGYPHLRPTPSLPPMPPTHPPTRSRSITFAFSDFNLESPPVEVKAGDADADDADE